MISPRVVSNPATETIRWNEVIGRASQEPTWLNGANFGLAREGAASVTFLTATPSPASGIPVSAVSAVSLESAPRRRSRDSSVATPIVPRRERRPRPHHRGRRSR